MLSGGCVEMVEPNANTRETVITPKTITIIMSRSMIRQPIWHPRLWRRLLREALTLDGVCGDISGVEVFGSLSLYGMA